MTGWYHIFIEQYAFKAAPFTKLLRKKVVFRWSHAQQKAFKELKQALVSAPVLRLPDFTKPFEVTTDASGVAVGAVLSQENYPVAYASRKLKPYEANYATHDLELLAIVFVLKLWWHYLPSGKFTIYSDHKSLKWIFTQSELNNRQRRWLQLIQEYDFDLLYKPGKHNLVANALSKKAFVEDDEPVQVSKLFAITLAESPLLEAVKEKLLNDAYFKKVSNILDQGP